MKPEHESLQSLIGGMRDAFSRGENAIAFAREHCGESSSNLVAATLIAYDLQAGSYTAGARANPQAKAQWCKQVADLIRPVLPQGGRLLEVGVGEATTLAGVLDTLGTSVSDAFGFDISWSRVREGNLWLSEKRQTANLFVADLFNIPLADESVDVVYTSHSLEPNGGREEAAIAECLRVARTAVVLIEPIYELSNAEAQARMRHHGYVRGLHDAAQDLGAEIREHRLLDFTVNELNPSGVLVLGKSGAPTVELAGLNALSSGFWRCPLTSTKLEPLGDLFFGVEMGVAYPVVRGIPLLRPEHAFVASRIDAE